MMVKLNGFIFWLKMITYWKIVLLSIKDKVSSDIKNKESESELVYNKNVLETNIKFYGDEAWDFHDKENSKVESNHTCLAVINIAFSLKKDKNYYLQELLKEK